MEATDPAARDWPARQRRTTEDACADGLAQQFATLLAARALSLLPHCDALEATQHRNAATQLQACSLLSGDRLAAAGAFNAAHPLSSVHRAEEFAVVDNAFQSKATLDWAGERSSAGLEAAARLWTARVTGLGRTRLLLSRVHGERYDRVKAEGLLSRWLDVPGKDQPVHTQARVEQIWVREPHGLWQIERATVGAFERRADP